MTTRKDVIASAPDRRARLVYTCNCGWIDRTHASTETTRSHVGPKSLWTQVQGDRGQRSKKIGAAGYQVVYAQDMGTKVLGRVITTGVTRKYFVRSGLSNSDKESVALAIFMEVSLAFEDYQDAFPRVITNSGFSQEDLVSNLIAFYSVVRPMDYLALCVPVSEADALRIWDTFGAVGDSNNKNRTFRPVLTASHACKGCSKATKTFPVELQAISPAAKGALFRDWLDEDELGDVAAQQLKEQIEGQRAVIGNKL